MAELDPSKSKLKIPAQTDYAPAGLNQTSTRLTGAQERFDTGQSKLAPWMPQATMLETAKSWYAGANAEGVSNGWDTTFYRNAFSQYDQWQSKAKDAGRGSVFYGWLDPQQNPNATGVATWGADPTDETARGSGQIRFGDVYNAGQKVGNVYDDYDKATADVLMGEFLFDPQDKERWFRDPNRQSIYSDEVEKYRKENTDRALYSRSAEDFDRNVQARERDIRKGFGNEALLAGGVAGSAAIGATAGAVAGSFVPVIGNVLGAIAGGLIGGTAGLVGGYLNQDQLIEMTARSMEKADIANQTFSDDWFKRATMNIGEFSQLGMQVTNSFSNVVQGYADKKYGEIGDMSADFYKVDAEGNRIVSNYIKGADIIATLVDGALKWSSPFGIWTDMTLMGGVALGSAGEISTGSVFNERRGEFDPLDNWQEKSAALANSGIDWLQLGVAGGFMKAARSARAAFTGEAGAREAAGATGVYGAADAAGPLAKGLDKAWAKTRGVEVTDRAVNSAGMRYMLDAQGDVVSSRMTLELLVPSEFLRWIPAGWQARRLAKIDGGAVTRDHMLKASTDLMTNSNFRNAVLMGYSEGGEEFVQAWLEPMATGDRANWGDAFQAYMYGAAGGAGMGLGMAQRGPTSAQQMQARAYVQHSLRTKNMMSPKEWKEFTKGWTPADFEKVARTDDAGSEAAANVLSAIADQQRQDLTNHSPIGYAKTEAVTQAKFEDLQKKALEEGNNSLVLLGQTAGIIMTPQGRTDRNKYGPQSAVMSAKEAVHQVDLTATGFKQQLKRAKQELLQAKQSEKDTTDPGEKQHFTDLVSEMTARVADLEVQASVARQIADKILEQYRITTQQTDPALWERSIAGLNDMLERAYTGQWQDNNKVQLPPDQQRLIRKAVEVKLARHPFQDRGSFTVLMPQVSEELTRANANGAVYLPQGVLKALGADHDGDTGIPLHTTYFTDDDVERMRRGDQYMEMVEDENGKRSYTLRMDPPDGEWAFIASFLDATTYAGSHMDMTVRTALYMLGAEIKNEFSRSTGGPFDDAALDTIVEEFKESVIKGRVDARTELVTKMMNLDFEGFRNHDNGFGVANPQWLWWKVSETFDILQKDLAHGRASAYTHVPISEQQEAQEVTHRSEIAREDAGSASASLSLLTTDAVRGAQFLHYSALYRALTEIPGGPKGTMTTQQQLALTELFRELGSGQTAKDIELITGRNAIEERVYYWLSMMANSVQDVSMTRPEVMLLLANLSVPSAKLVAGTTNTYQVQDGNITMLQLLLERSLDIEAAKHHAAEPDSDIAKKIRNLRRLTKRDPNPKKHSSTPSLALLEVFGNRPLHELIGKDSAYISPQMTLNQLVQQQRGLSQRDRSNEIHRLKRQPAYIKDREREYKDPPWPVSALTDGGINGYAMLVDAVQVGGDTYLPKMKERDANVQKRFVEGLTGLHQVLSSWRLLHSDRLSQGNSQVERIEVLRDMLANDTRMANDLAKLIPDAAALGVFELHKDGTVTSSAWLEQVLVEEKVERAIAQYYFNIKIAEWNQLSGTVDLSRIAQKEDYDPDKAIDIADVRGSIDPLSLKSRFHQVMFNLASQADSIELFRFLKAMNEAQSVADQFDMINTEPAWRNDQADLLPWHDDVSLFEMNPADSWNAGGDGSILRENIRLWGKSMKVRGAIALETELHHENDKTLLNGMHQWMKSRGTSKEVDVNGGKMYFNLLKRAVENRKLFPDTQGQVVRDQLVELQQLGLAQTQNKGAADPKAAPYGESMITLDSFGYVDPLMQEMAAITAEDVDDVMTNLTLLIEGPVRIGLEDGSTLIFDISTPEKALDMLMDPMTRELAKTILFPTVRDVNNANVLQHYIDTDSKGGLAKMLREQTHKDLFDERSDYNEKVRQAHAYIGRVEGYYRRQALKNGVKDPEFQPIQQMVHDFIAVYQHSKDTDEDPTKMRNQLFIDIADAIKQVASVAEDNRADLKERIAAVMESRFMSDNARLDRLLDNDDVRKSFFELKQMEKQFDIFQEALDDFDARYNAATTQAEQDQILAEKRDFVRESRLLQGGFGYPHQTFLNAASAMAMFTQTGTSIDQYRQTEILDYLGKNNRIHEAEKKGNQGLYHKAIRKIYTDPTGVILEEAEWKELASWAAQIYLNETTTRGSSSIPISASLNGDDADVVRRYHDQSFSYLIDNLFDPTILEAADRLSQQGAHYQRRTKKEVTKSLTEGLLSDKRIGTWTEVVFNESMKARMVLKNSPVGAAIQMEGSDPPELADFVGAGKVTWARPEQGHFTDVDLAGAPGQRLKDTLVDPLATVSLHNHFVTSVVIQSTDPNSPLDPDLADALLSVTSVNQTSAETTAAGSITLQPGQSPSQAGALRVLDLNALDARIEWLKSTGKLTGGFTVAIKYVDVNKKPFTRKYANNIFFDGVGREVVGGSGYGAVASLFFGLNALNKIGQQNPLDMATKKGKGFKAWMRSRLEKAEQLEAGGATVAEVLAAKAQHLLDQDYPMGKLLHSDLPSLYKLMKMRHVVVGTNPTTGAKEVWWAEKAIEMQQAQTPIPLDNWRLVSLTKKQAQTLWGRSGAKGLKAAPGSMVRPTFNIGDLNIFPDLSQEKLDKLGLGRLGDVRTDVGNTRLAQVSSLPRAVATFERGKTYTSLYKKRLRDWRGEAQQVNRSRGRERRSGEGVLDIERINRDGAQLVTDMIMLETQTVTNKKLGIPDQGIVDMAALQVSRSITAQIKRAMEFQNSMIWVYRHGLGSDQTQGVLGRAELADNYAGLGNTGPTFGDVAIVDLSDILNSTDVKDYQGAAAEAKKVMKVLAGKGMTVVLNATQGHHDLRADIVEELTSGSLGYRPMGDSSNIFVPVTEDAEFNAAQRAIASSLLETQQIDTRNVAVRMVSDDVSTGLSEGTEWLDSEHDRAYNTVSHTILPFRMVSTGSVGRRNPFAFGQPQRGMGRADQLGRVNAQLQMILSGPEGRTYLKELLGPENNYPKYVEHENGMIEHGVLSLDDALDNLEQQVKTGKWALDKNETFYWGTIVPVVSGDGSIHLSRIGFKQPEHSDMTRQRKLRYNDKQMKLTATTGKLDDQQTLPPPTRVDELRNDVKGFSVVGTYVPGANAKSISEGIGLKTGLAPMPANYHFPDAPIKSTEGAGVRVTRIAGSTSVVGKEARRGLINNFRDGFALTGMDFTDDMVDFFFGVNAGRSDEDKAELRDLTVSILKQWAAQPPRFTGVQLSRILDDRSMLVTMEARFNAIGAAVAPQKFQGISLRPPVGQPQSANSRLGQIILASLAAPGVEVEHVLSTPGISTVKSHDDGSLVRFMPALMTDALNDPAHPELRKELIARMNRNMPTDPNNPNRRLQWFDNELKFHSIMTQDFEGGSREEEIVGFLQIHVPIPADENALRLTYAGVQSKGKETKHVADVTAETVGGRLMPKATSKARKNIPSALDEVFGQNTIERFEDTDMSTAALYNMLTRVRVNGEAYNPWQQRQVMEEIHYVEAGGKVRQYTYLGQRNKKTGWSKSEIVEGNRIATEFLNKLNITDPKAVNEVEYLVRQLYGIPGPAQGQKDYKERLSFKVFQSGVEYMGRNIRAGMHPLEGGIVPLEHEVFWKMVHDAQLEVDPDRRWLPLSNGNSIKEYAAADDWGDWVDSLMGQVRASKGQFDSRFSTDLDGFYHTYQGTHPDYMDMAVSMQQQISAKLLDPETNRPFVSFDPGRDAWMREPVVLASEYMTYDALVGKGAVTVQIEADDATDSVLSKRMQEIDAWQRGEGLPKQKDLSVKEYAKQGAQYRESSRTTSNAMRNMINASVMMRLFNPALYFSAMLEVPYRSALEGATNVLTGQLTGRRGMAVAQGSEWLQDKLDKLKVEGVQVAPRYSTNEIATLNQLNKTMGSSNRFLGLVYGELAYQTVVGGGRGKVGEKLEMGAAAVARMTADPMWGMKSDSLAKRYNDAVWEYLAMTNSQITVEQYAYQMKLDPTWLEGRDPRAHAMGVNAVKQARGAKSTVVSNIIMKPIERMTSSPNGFVNGTGHLIKVPFLFTRFNANMFITMTGLGGLDQMAAMFFDGRQSNKLIESMRKRAKLTENDTLTPEYWDLSEVIESIDLSRAFVRGAVTQTALMAMGMMAGGLSLGGEDEEERRRKRLATYLNTPYYHDPNKAANDWRWTDAIFLDNVPVLSNIFSNETGHSAVVPHWIIRQFTSPILGMMRFFETGNVMEITAGFHDAYSVIPTTVTRLWNDADQTTQLLLEAAEDDELLYEKQVGVSQFFTNIVMVYEKALMENAFINTLYQARDDFDRNPWAVQKTDGMGNIVREEGTGNPVQTEALQPYTRELEGGGQSNRVGYATRKNRDALIHQYTEGNATAALLMSVLPWVQGEQSSYLRGNMVTKKQQVQAAETPTEQVEALIFSAFLGQGGQDFFTKEEIIGAIKQREQAADRRWEQSAVEAEADAIYASVHEAPLTIFSDGAEKMTLEGKEGVFRSLRDGIIGLDDPAIAGFHVLPEERDAIAERLTTALVQEGVDFGLSEQSAMYRMRRIWYGDGTDPAAPGLRELLYDKRIPSKPYVEYDQLNVTYVLGPDGKPWATPFTRASILGAMGLPIPHTMAPTIEGVTKRDQRGNIVNLLNQTNTGLAGIQPRPIQPEEVEPKDTAVKAAESKSYTPGGRRRYGGGGGGYSSSSYGPPFQRMYALPAGTSPRADSIPMINTNAPYIRRADVRRERISSERGRLKQWQ